MLFFTFILYILSSKDIKKEENMLNISSQKIDKTAKNTKKNKIYYSSKGYENYVLEQNKKNIDKCREWLNICNEIKQIEDRTKRAHNFDTVKYYSASEECKDYTKEMSVKNVISRFNSSK